MSRRRIAILGGTGYGGAELLRLLLAHPEVEVIRMTSRKQHGRSVTGIHRNLLGLTDLRFENREASMAGDDADLVFAALPHGTSQDAIAALPEDTAVVDLSGDFRLGTAETYEAAYGRPHNAPELLDQFVYGLTEFERDRIRRTQRVANPGCFATACILALMPLARAGRLDGPVALNGVTGSSGSGAEPKTTTHHPERATAFRAYKPLVHQHLPEIEEELIRGGTTEPKLSFVPHSAPFVRGIHITAMVHCSGPIEEEELKRIYREAYGRERFIRLVDRPPDVASVTGSNFADVHVRSAGSTALVLVAIDNLVKGMAGQAIQNMNLVLGFPEETGLMAAACRP